MVESLEIRIVELLGADLDSLFSIADIAKKLGVAYSHAHLFVNRLVKQDVITTQKVGKTIVCRLNLVC